MNEIFFNIFISILPDRYEGNDTLYIPELFNKKDGDGGFFVVLAVFEGWIQVSSATVII